MSITVVNGSEIKGVCRNGIVTISGATEKSNGAETQHVCTIPADYLPNPTRVTCINGNISPVIDNDTNKVRSIRLVLTGSDAYKILVDYTGGTTYGVYFYIMYQLV